MSGNMKITSFFFTASFLLLLSQFYDRHPSTGVSVDSFLCHNALCEITDTCTQKRKLTFYPLRSQPHQHL